MSRRNRLTLGKVSLHPEPFGVRARLTGCTTHRMRHDVHVSQRREGQARLRPTIVGLEIDGGSNGVDRAVITSAKSNALPPGPSHVSW